MFALQGSEVRFIGSLEGVPPMTMGPKRLLWVLRSAADLQRTAVLILRIIVTEPLIMPLGPKL